MQFHKSTSDTDTACAYLSFGGFAWQHVTSRLRHQQCAVKKGTMSQGQYMHVTFTISECYSYMPPTKSYIPQK